MAKQTFTTGQVLTAAQMTSLQQTAMGGGSTTAKTANYVLTAADAGTVVQMNAAGATTITVNTALFAAGDTVQIQNIGAGVCTVTAGTATVSTAGSLALSQYEGGQLYFNSTSAAIFFDLVQSGGGGKVLQVVMGTPTSTEVSNSTTTLVDSGITATITPTLATSKVLVLITMSGVAKTNGNSGSHLIAALFRGVTNVLQFDAGTLYTGVAETLYLSRSFNYLDSPATTSATTYKVQFSNSIAAAAIKVQADAASTSTIILLEIGA
jgi:hypothetical protein